MKLAILVTTAAFAPERRAGFERIVTELREQLDDFGVLVNVVTYENHDRSSHMAGAYAALDLAMSDPYVTHVCGLPDDAILVPHFIDVLLRCVLARPDDIIDLVSNHSGARAAYESGHAWYSTLDGAIMGTTMRVDMWRAYLAWRRESVVDDARVPFDDGLHIWASQQRKRIYKPLPSLCQHDLTIPSTTGNQHQTDDPKQRVVRESQVWDPKADLRDRDWSGPCAELGRMFERAHWEAFWNTKPESWDVEAVYRVARNGAEVDPKHVLVCMMAYAKPPEIETYNSVQRAVADLSAHGYRPQLFLSHGQSAVARGRHALVHQFMRSTASYFVQWDSDIELRDPTALRRMIETGHGVIGGACPFRSLGGAVVANPTPGFFEAGAALEHDGSASIKVKEIGTGFLMVRRHVIADLMQRHPELLYEADAAAIKGQPQWALFDFTLQPTENGRKRYASEDWRFCEIARDAGYDVWCYTPPTFRHWSRHGFDGHIVDAWRLDGFAQAAE